MTDSERKGWMIGGILSLGVVAAALFVFTWTARERGAVSAFTRLLSAANSQDVTEAKSLCSARYLSGHPLETSAEGGILGLPRNIHKNFRAWGEGPDVLICPSNRVGPIYRLVEEQGTWKFDGAIGLLQSDGKVARMPEEPLPERPAPPAS